MPVYALGERSPDIHPDAYVHPDAIGHNAVVAAGAVAPPNTHVPARRMAVGVPARIRLDGR